MKNAKKVLSIVLALAMVLLMAVPSFASSDYDRKKVAANDITTIDALSAEQIAGVIIDWANRKIAEVTADFTSFNQEVNVKAAGQDITVQIPVNFEVNDIDDIIGYKDYVSVLGGDFANLDMTNLKTREESGSDIAFINNVIQFMADNSETLGKVFGWTEGTTFDYGNVGTYIESLEEGNEIRTFYEDYLIGGDIQTAFVNEIAKEMGYTVPEEGETFDETLDNGIKEVVIGFLQDADLLSDDAADTIRDDDKFDLKTTDVYTLVKNLFTLVQSDNWTKATTLFTYACDNIVRPVLKTAFGYTLTTTTEAAPDAVLDEFNKTYTDKDELAQYAGKNDVLFQAVDGSYYSIKADGTSGVKVSYGESFLNFEAPSVEIWDAEQKVGGAYTPTSTEVTDYEPTVYTDDYSQYVDTSDLVAEAGEFGVTVSTDELPEAIANIIAAGNGVAMKDKFVMKINGKVLGTDLSESPIEISFKDVEAAVNAELAEQLPSIQAQVDSTVASAVATVNSMRESNSLIKMMIPNEVTGSVTINSLTVSLSYTGYSDEDTFVCQVTAVPDYDLTYGGDVWTYASYAGITQDKIESDYIQPAIDAAVTNPVATIVVDNLNGTIDGLDDLTALMNYVDTDFDVDTSILDLAADYDAYKGFVGQANKVLCEVAKMVLSDEGYTSLGLTEGGNANLTANMQKICDKTDSLLSAAKTYMDKADFAAFADEIDLDSAFASEHGFNADMLYDLDFSDVENVYVCAIRMGCDLLVEDTDSVAHDIHEIVEDLDSLEQIAVGLFNYAMPKVADKANELLKDAGITVSFTATTEASSITSDADAKDYIMTKAVDMLYDVANQAVAAGNKIINDKIAEVWKNIDTTTAAPEVNFVLGVEKGTTWEATLTNLVNRFYGLTKGIISTLAADDADVYTKIDAVANGFFPLSSMLSNAGANGANGNISTAYLMNVLFDQCLDGNFDNFLALFEVKDDELAGDCSVTQALIRTSQHMVDPVFPGTVVASAYADYTPATEVQEYFTGSYNDTVIASNNMKSINTVKANFVPAALNLVREAGLLPWFAQCTSHTWTVTAEVAATCTTAGKTEYKVCSVCGATEGGEEIPALGHSYGDWVVSKAATCTEAGTKTATCTRCNATQTETIPATGHSYGAWTVTTAPTCTTKGVETSTCTKCNAKQTRDVAATGHSYGDWVTTTAPTCVNEGVQTATCTKCGATKTQAVAATGNHVDADGDNACDTCGKIMQEEQQEDTSFFGKIKAFFQKIINFFRNLFKK